MECERQPRGELKVVYVSDNGCDGPLRFVKRRTG